VSYERPADVVPPEHDPIADEQDLLTIEEAAARLEDQLRAARARLIEAEGSAEHVDRIDGLRRRVDALEIGMQRYDLLLSDRSASSESSG
jgi:hypothetical protein